MKINQLAIFSFVLVISSGCLYTVNEQDSLSIVFNDSKLSARFIKNYIDSVRNKGLIIPGAIEAAFYNGDSLRWDESLVYFNSSPKEWYLVNFSSTPGSIERIYNPDLSREAISRKEDLTEEKIAQIELRYRKQILDSVIIYGRKRHLPDSVIFNTKMQKPPYDK